MLSGAILLEEVSHGSRVDCGWVFGCGSRMLTAIVYGLINKEVGNFVAIPR